jgi:hypothetical protein
MHAACPANLILLDSVTKWKQLLYLLCKNLVEPLGGVAAQKTSGM